MRQQTRTLRTSAESTTDADAIKHERADEVCARRAVVRVLCAAAVLHLLLSVAVYVSGRAALLPATFDENGVAVSFASDGVRYRADAAGLSETLWRGELRAWATADRPFHVKLYSVCFALFGPVLGYSILGAEPLNSLLYLACVALVFCLGREVFGVRAGLLAACAVALWPSFLLHTTQLLKDPLFAALTLALVLVNVRWLKPRTWAGAMGAAAAGGLVVTPLWLARSGMGAVTLSLVVLDALALGVWQLRERRLYAANVAGAALVFALTLAVPRLAHDALELGRSPMSVRWAEEHSELLEQEKQTNQKGFLSGAVASVRRVRRAFVEVYKDSGSNVDADVRIDSLTDLLFYLPRAAEVGFFAPFPNMWLASGKSVGRAGRLLGGFESLLMYAVEALALIALWRARKRLDVWLLFASAATGIVALGLVAVNVGTLYRLRYVFVMLLIVIAAEVPARFNMRRSNALVSAEERGAGA